MRLFIGRTELVLWSTRHPNSDWTFTIFQVLWVLFHSSVVHVMYMTVAETRRFYSESFKLFSIFLCSLVLFVIVFVFVLYFCCILRYRVIVSNRRIVQKTFYFDSLAIVLFHLWIKFSIDVFDLILPVIRFFLFIWLPLFFSSLVSRRQRSPWFNNPKNR